MLASCPVMIRILIILVIVVVNINCYIIDPGPTVIATKGEVWPKPQHQLKQDTYLVVRPKVFIFNVITSHCPELLQEAIERYQKIILREVTQSGNDIDYSNSTYKGSAGYLDSLNVEIGGPCDDANYPALNSSENYTLFITQADHRLSSSTIWGILRGLETFSQLIYFDVDQYKINLTEIVDYPRFPHRGLLVDTSRHFIPVKYLMKTLEAMAYNKMNVFHWHITDDQSFPYQSRTFPELSNRGAYHPVSKIYTQADIKMVIEFARRRGIRVIPEFDTPGHTRSWGEAFPELLTECYASGRKTGKLGPIDPTKNNTYSFLNKFFDEIVKVFHDKYVHLGGDEVEFECWESNPQISAFMQENNIKSYSVLESYFIQNLVTMMDRLNTNYLVWEEVFVNGIALSNSTIVHIWRDTNFTVLAEATKAGKFALLSSCWYLDHLQIGGDWKDFYICDPYNFNGSIEQKSLILGGEACMWSEVVNEYNLLSRVWPRASTIAERLWSSANVKDLNDAAKRLEEHTCRMNRRGIDAQPPNAAGVCL